MLLIARETKKNRLEAERRWRLIALVEDMGVPGHCLAGFCEEVGGWQGDVSIRMDTFELGFDG